jgi:Domain of unknown function (DUF6398)
MSRQSRPPVPLKMLPVYDAVTDLTDSICKEHLTDEYTCLAREMAAALCRKRPSPLAQGQVNSWACGVLVALGRINWLFDRSQNPYFKMAELCDFFGVAQSTGAAKATQIKKALNLKFADPRWTLASKMDDHPYAWVIELNGFPVDVRMLQKHIQEKLFEAGLIPYLPPERMSDAE